MSLPGSSRWCPTPEQLMILEEIYRGGIRTPKASQIQKITAHLSLYGKIEGKNVFYWFQNHKARDRQKLRRKQLFLAKQQQQQQQQQQQHHRHHYLHSPLALHHHHHPPNSYHNSPPFRHLGGGVEDDSSSTLLKHYTWKTNIPAERCQEKIINRLYGQDHWMTMIGVGPTSPPPCCNRTPLKTLQLFPTTSSSSTTTSSNPSKVELELSIDN